MQKLILSIALFFTFSLPAQCQSNDDGTLQKPETIYTKVDVEAAFTGGGSAWRNFLQNNLKTNIPIANAAPAGMYTVIVKFIVYRNGTINNITTETNHGFGMEAEASRLIRQSSRWAPAIFRNNKVSSYRRQSITFVVP